MTKKFGIIGNPINHSLSPILHNYWFKKYKIDASYSILEINDNQLPEIIERIRRKDLIGINIHYHINRKLFLC